MPLFLRMQIVSTDGSSYEAIDAGKVTHTRLLSFNEDSLMALKALEQANEAAMELEPDN